jgi:hypothetical protein
MSLIAQNNEVFWQRQKMKSNQRISLKSASSSDIVYHNGYAKNENFSTLPFIYDVVDDVIYHYTDGKVIGYNTQTKTNVFESQTLNVFSHYSSWLEVDTQNNCIYYGFTIYGDTDDRIYKVDKTDGSWEHVATLACNFDAEVYKGTLYVSGLGYSNWNGQNDTNSIWKVDLTGNNNHKKLITIPGNSCGLAINSHGDIVCGSYDIPNGGYGVYYWAASMIDFAQKQNIILDTSTATTLAKLKSGIYDCEFDAGDNLYWNMNNFSTGSSLNKWNCQTGSGNNAITVFTQTAGGWLSMIKSSGNLSQGGKANLVYVAGTKEGLLSIYKNQSASKKLKSADGSVQNIAKVYDYTPAPGQFVNQEGFGTLKGAQGLCDGSNKLLTLGAWGGYVVVGFDQPIKNHPDNPYGVDFTIFGNAFLGSSEPGIVQVMKDVNGNGKPDDIWYELKGSSHYFQSTKYNYEVTYSNPNSLADVPYLTSDAKNGVVKYMSDYYKQQHYPLKENFPDIDQKSYSLQGSKLLSKTGQDNFVINYYMDFGYADNYSSVAGADPSKPDNPYTLDVQEGCKGDPFDIDWAIDSKGNHVNLDQIDFVRVYNGVLQHGGWLGEVSTEIKQISSVLPNASIKGVTDVIITSHPLVYGRFPVQKTFKWYKNETYQFESYLISRGRLNDNQNITWTSSAPEVASITSNGALTGHKTGTTTLTAVWAGNSKIKRTLKIEITADPMPVGTNKGANPKIPTAIEPLPSVQQQVYIHPAPVKDMAYISNVNNATIQIYNISGKLVQKLQNYRNGQKINLNNLTKGLYIVKILDEGKTSTLKFLKE